MPLVRFRRRRDKSWHAMILRLDYDSSIRSKSQRVFDAMRDPLQDSRSRMRPIIHRSIIFLNSRWRDVALAQPYLQLGMLLSRDTMIATAGRH